MKCKYLLFGSTGGIGSEVQKLIKREDLVCVNKKDLNFKEDIRIKLNKLLDEYNPDIIINSAGVFGFNDIDFNLIFNVNVRFNWYLLDYYINKNISKKVKIIMIGSSAYKEGRKKYILYAASKSALNNIYLGSRELFANTGIVLGLVHPNKVNTNMIKDFRNVNANSPKYVAQKIVNFTNKITKSTQIEII